MRHTPKTPNVTKQMHSKMIKLSYARRYKILSRSRLDKSESKSTSDTTTLKAQWSSTLGHQTSG